MTNATEPTDSMKVPAIGNEFVGAKLGDARLTRRLVHTARACAEAPEKSLPRAIGSKTALNAAYELFSHESAGEAAILRPHQDQTRKRCTEVGTVLVAHDTTEFVYSTHREGIGHLRSVKDHGFLMHGSLVLTADGHQRPLGVIGARYWTRSLEDAMCDCPPDMTLESERWFEQVVAAEERLGPDVVPIHLMDREGDSYKLFADMCGRSSRFVIRNRTDRVARSEDLGPTEHIRTLCERAEVVFETQVPISRRSATSIPVKSTSLLPREARIAKLSVRAVTVEIRKPQALPNDLPMWLELNAVYVQEVDAPEAVEPVQWVLLTTEPIDTYKDVVTVIEYYRTRWVIEEWHKAIKTGCKVEDLQLESYEALKNAITMYLVLAWRMLLMRTLARSEPNAPAEIALSSAEIVVLREFQSDARLPKNPTVGQAFIAIAMMGGYIKHKVPPGWLTLARGFEKLILLENGWSAGRARPKDGRDL